jgi:outer membrane protein TolC
LLNQYRIGGQYLPAKESSLPALKDGDVLIRKILMALLLAGSAAAQVTSSGLQTSQPGAASGAPQTITFHDALTLARANSPQLAIARADAGIAHEDKVQARAALLPSLNYNGQFIYTEPNGRPEGVFVGNNGPREYVSRGNAHQDLGFENAIEYRRAAANEALARAKYDIAARGLVVTVAQNYYGLLAAQRKLATAQTGGEEARRFLTVSQQLERGGEVAHSDVIKAQLQVNDRLRDEQDARLAEQKARIGLAVLLFRDFNQNFSVVDDMTPAAVLPDFAEVQTAAIRNNPDLRSALAGMRAADLGVRLAWAGYLPSFGFDYWYGIDANNLALHAPDGTRNLGYSAAATVNLPVWNWGATQSKVRQAQLRRDQAKVELSATQRQLVANLQTFYAEAAAARAQLDLLRQSYELAAESLRLTTLRYRGGEATVLEVVDAQNALIQAKNAYDDGEVRYKTALANLQTLTGNL